MFLIEQSLNFYFKDVGYKINYLISEEYKSQVSFKVAALAWCIITPLSPMLEIVKAFFHYGVSVIHNLTGDTMP